MRWPSLKTSRVLAVLLWLVVGSYQLWQLRHAPIGDFANYYYASQALAQGNLADAQLYEPYLFNLWVDERSPAPVFVNYAPVPPISVLAYLPFAQVSNVYQAKLLFNGLGLLLFVGVFWWGSEVSLGTPKDRSIVHGQQSMVKVGRTIVDSPWSMFRFLGWVNGLWIASVDRLRGARLKNFDQLESGLDRNQVANDTPYCAKLGEHPSTMDHGPITLLLLPLLLWTPLYNNLYQGQSYLYLVSCLWLGWLCWKKEWKLGASLLWAIPIALKVFPAIVLLFLVLKRDGYTLVWTVLFTLGLSALPSFWLGTPTVVEYYQEILPRLFAGEINDPYTILYQSARVFLDQLLVLDEHLNPDPVLHAPGLAACLYLGFQWMVLGLLVQLGLKRQLSDLFRLGLVMLSGLLVSGYGSNYSMLLLFFAAIGLGAQTSYKTIHWGIGLLLLFMAGNIPIYRLQGASFVWQFPRLYALILFLGLIYYLERPRFRAEVWIGLGLLLLVKMVLPSSSKTQLADYYLPDGSYPIIFDYEPSPSGLLLHHYHGQGPETASYDTPDQIYKDAKLRILHDQVFYGDQQLSQSRSRKKKPLRLNEREVIYLSDEGRGVGFYTLRKLVLP